MRIYNLEFLYHKTKMFQPKKGEAIHITIIILLERNWFKLHFMEIMINKVFTEPAIKPIIFLVII